MSSSIDILKQFISSTYSTTKGKNTATVKEFVNDVKNDKNLLKSLFEKLSASDDAGFDATDIGAKLDSNAFFSVDDTELDFRVDEDTVIKVDLDDTDETGNIVLFNDANGDGVITADEVDAGLTNFFINNNQDAMELLGKELAETPTFTNLDLDNDSKLTWDEVIKAKSNENLEWAEDLIQSVAEKEFMDDSVDGLTQANLFTDVHNNANPTDLTPDGLVDNGTYIKGVNYGYHIPDTGDTDSAFYSLEHLAMHDGKLINDNTEEGSYNFFIPDSTVDLGDFESTLENPTVNNTFGAYEAFEAPTGISGISIYDFLGVQDPNAVYDSKGDRLDVDISAIRLLELVQNNFSTINALAPQVVADPKY